MSSIYPIDDTELFLEAKIMRDAILLSALRIPYEMALESELGSRIFYSQAQTAADRIEADTRRISELEVALQHALLKSTQNADQERPVDTLTGLPECIAPAPEPISTNEQQLSDRQIFGIAVKAHIQVRNRQRALHFARAVVAAARVGRLSDKHIVNIALETKTPIQTGKGAVRFARVLLAEIRLA